MNSISTRAPPQTPLGELLQRSIPDPLAGYNSRGLRGRKEGRARGKEGTGKDGREEGK